MLVVLMYQVVILENKAFRSRSFVINSWGKAPKRRKKNQKLVSRKNYKKKIS